MKRFRLYLTPTQILDGIDDPLTSEAGPLDRSTDSDVQHYIDQIDWRCYFDTIDPYESIEAVSEAALGEMLWANYRGPDCFGVGCRWEIEAVEVTT